MGLSDITRSRCELDSHWKGSSIGGRLGANGSRECAPDDKLRDTHRVTTHAEQADGFRKRSTHPTGYGLVRRS